MIRFGYINTSLAANRVRKSFNLLDFRACSNNLVHDTNITLYTELFSDSTHF